MPMLITQGIFRSADSSRTEDALGRKLEDLGITDVIVGFRKAYEVGGDRMPLADKLAAIRRYGDSIIAKVS